MRIRIWLCYLYQLIIFLAPAACLRQYDDPLRVAYIHDVSGKGEVWTMSLEGGEAKAITSGSLTGYSNPVWSPDGTRMVFSTSSGIPTIFSADVESGAIGIVTLGGYPTWSPDGKRLVFVRNTCIYSADSETGGNELQLTSPTSPYEDSYPACSPDGKKIVFIRGDGGSFAIYSINAPDGGNESLLNNSGIADDSCPTYSPDGRLILYVHSSGSIYVMNADGSNQRLLTANAHYPAWTPDGSQVLFSSNATGFWELCIMNSDGVNRRQLTSEMNYNRNPSVQGKPR